MRTAIEGATGDEVLFRLPANSNTAIVAFAQRGAGGANVPYGPILERLPATTKIVLRDPSSLWYQMGVPGVGETLNQIAERLKREIAELGASRIVTFGSSMGGYAAILFGCMLDAARAVAVAPQTFLEPFLGHGPPEGTTLRAPDLDPFVRDSPQTEVDLVVAWDNLVDVVHAQHVAAHPSTRVLALNSASHTILTDLYRSKTADSFLSEDGEETVVGLTRVNPPCDPADLAAIEVAVFAEIRGDWRSARDRIEPVASRHPRWAGPSFHLGRALLRLGEAAAAERALRRALSLNPKWLAVHSHLGDALARQGELTEAEEVLRDAVDLNGGWLMGQLQLAELLTHKDDEEARELARKVEQSIRRKARKQPRLRLVSRMLCRSLQLQGRVEEAQGAAVLASSPRA